MCRPGWGSCALSGAVRVGWTELEAPAPHKDGDSLTHAFCPALPIPRTCSTGSYTEYGGGDSSWSAAAGSGTTGGGQPGQLPLYKTGGQTCHFRPTVSHRGSRSVPRGRSPGAWADWGLPEALDFRINVTLGPVTLGGPVCRLRNGVTRLISGSGFSAGLWHGCPLAWVRVFPREGRLCPTRCLHGLWFHSRELRCNQGLCAHELLKNISRAVRDEREAAGPLGPGVWGASSCSQPTCKRKLSSGSHTPRETPLSTWESVFDKNNSS